MRALASRETNFFCMSRSVILICSTVCTDWTWMEEPAWKALIHRSRFSRLSVANVSTPSRLGCFTWGGVSARVLKLIMFSQ